MTTNTTPTTCPEMVASGRVSLSACGREFRNAEQTEAKLCGLHLSAKKRRAAKDAAWTEARKANTDLAAVIRGREATLKAHGLTYADIQTAGKYGEHQTITGRVVVRLEELEALLAKLDTITKESCPCAS